MTEFTEIKFTLKTSQSYIVLETTVLLKYEDLQNEQWGKCRLNLPCYWLLPRDHLKAALKVSSNTLLYVGLSHLTSNND